MKKSRYTESQIITILKTVEAGRQVKDICREYGISDATYYNWKAKYGGMEASDIKRMKELEDENRRLKQMYANLSLEHTILKDIIEKKLESLPKSGNQLERFMFGHRLRSNGSRKTTQALDQVCALFIST